MADQTLKALLIQTVDAARLREPEFHALCDERPATSDRWTARDHVVHLTAWRRHAAAVLRAASRDDSFPEPPAPDIDAENARIHAAGQGMPPDRVIAGAVDSYRALAGAIESCSPAQLGRLRAGRPTEVWRVVPGNGHPHLAQHLVQWHIENGD